MGSYLPGCFKTIHLRRLTIHRDQIKATRLCRAHCQIPILNQHRRNIFHAFKHDPCDFSVDPIIFNKQYSGTEMKTAGDTNGYKFSSLAASLATELRPKANLTLAPFVPTNTGR